MIGWLADFISATLEARMWSPASLYLTPTTEDKMHDENRKEYPLVTGMLDYFPDALLAVANVSMEGARKHGTFTADGRPTWDRTKSTDDADALGRHLLGRGKFDIDGHRHSAKVAWRALAVLQRELDAGAEAAALNGDDYERKGDGATARTAALSTADMLKTMQAGVAFDPGRQESTHWWFSIPSRGRVSVELPGGTSPKPQPDSLLKQHEGLTEIEQFATWLTTRNDCVHVGAKHAVYDMFEAVEEWYRSHPRAKG